MADLYVKKRVTTDTLVKTGRGFLHNILVSSVGTNGTLTIYDNTSESGTAPGSTLTAIPLVTRAAGSQLPISLRLDIPFKLGLYFGYDGTLVAEFLVSYR